jgi:DNA-binding response OmpR family regulator
VLVVEDDEALAESIARALRDGFAVDVEHDGLAGLWRATEMTYDVIILDVMLPGMKGGEVCRTLRSRGVQTPVLMLTALVHDDDEHGGFDAGADDYVRKPFSPRLLVARAHALARRGASTPPVVTVGGLSLDPRRRTCSRDGEPVALTSREFAVLEALLRRSPTVVSKRELLDLVWGFDFEGDPSIVEVYVSYIRRKIDKGRPASTISTVRGAGYRVDL